MPGLHEAGGRDAGRRRRAGRTAAACLSGLAAVAAAQAQPERAARLFGAAEALREAMGSQLLPLDYGGYPHHLGATRAQLGEETFGAAWGTGQAMTLQQAVDYAIAEPGPDTAPQ